METKNLAELYDLPPIPWERAQKALESGEPQKQTTFLATTRPDGRPHLTGVGALWDDGKAYVVSGPDTRKSQNLAENPNCAISMAYDGIDLVIEGTAERVTDDATLQRIAKRYARRRLARPRRGPGVHLRLQRPERRPAALVPVRGHANHGLRRPRLGARRRHALALRRLGVASADDVSFARDTLGRSAADPRMRSPPRRLTATR